MRFPRLLPLALVALFAPSAFSQALYAPPVNKVGAALAEGLTQTLVSRGFAANDPRIFQTVRAVGARVLPLAAAAGSGSNWLALVARLSPWVTAGLLVYTGVKWYFDSQGNVVTSIGAASPGGVVLGGDCYFVIGSSFCAGSPEQAMVWYVTTQTYWVDVTVLTLTPQSTSGPSARYLASYSGHRQGDTVTIWQNYNQYSIFAGTASATCPGGQGALNGACVSANMDKYQPASSSSSPQPIQTAYNNLPQAAKDGSLSPELAAELANRIWRDAALQPGYDGVPWSSARPVQSSDFSPFQTAHPGDWPSTSSLNDAVPTASTPLTSPESNPNQVNAPTSATKVDLGPDPGVAPPSLEDPPTQLFKPIKDLMSPWLNWSVPSHSSECPTFQASPSIAGRVFTIDLSTHCTFVEPYRATVLAVSLACWAVLAAFIILAA